MMLEQYDWVVLAQYIVQAGKHGMLVALDIYLHEFDPAAIKKRWNHFISDGQIDDESPGLAVRQVV